MIPYINRFSTEELQFYTDSLYNFINGFVDDAFDSGDFDDRYPKDGVFQLIHNLYFEMDEELVRRSSQGIP